MPKVSLVFIPAFAAGHLISMLEFAKSLLAAAAATANELSITVLLIKPPARYIPTSLLSYIQFLASSGLNIHFNHLPELHLLENTESLKIDGPEDAVSLLFQLYKHHVQTAISSSPVPVNAVFIDLFATALIDVTNELSVPAYVYFPSNALMLGLTLHLPTLDAKIPAEFDEVEGDVEVPGVVAVPATSMPSPWMDKKNRCYTWFLYHGRRFCEAKGIVVNTINELEHDLLSALEEGRFVDGGLMPKVYPVGPVLSLRNGGDEKSGSDRGECLVWLDKQPLGSVVFLCFGSNGCFSPPQVREMAAGLEQSGHRFLWSVRNMVNGNEFELTDANLDELLPEGFLERTKERGLVWPSWAPQIEILSHGAVGGFVTHCGWNSCLESLWFGVPMLAWPLYAEQHLNEVEMVRDLGVAVGLKIDRKRGNFAVADELERGVRCLMGESDEGKSVRAKAAEMGLASRKAVEEGGSSDENLKKLVVDLCT